MYVRPPCPGLGVRAGTVGRRAAVVRLVILRNSAQLLERALYPEPDRVQRLRLRDPTPLPIRVGQHRMDQQISQAFPLDRDVQSRQPHPIGLQDLARAMDLLQHGGLLLMQRPPLGNPPLQGA